MAQSHGKDTLPKLGHVTDLREQWLVRTDGALAHRLQDREISSHLCENKHRNQQIREDFPVALCEQKGIEYEAQLREYARRRQTEIDSEIAREMAEINLRRQRRQHSVDLLPQPNSSHSEPIGTETVSVTSTLLNPEELGLSSFELEEMKKRLEQEEKDARLARQLSNEVDDQDSLLADMKYAVEAQDGELARLLQEREYKRLQRAKEKARQKALLKKQQRLLEKQLQSTVAEPFAPQATLCDAYSNPRDIIRENGLRLSKSVDSDLHYVEPFEKEQIQSKTHALQDKEISKKYYNSQIVDPAEPGTSGNYHLSSHSSLQHRQPPPPPAVAKKPRFPDPICIRPASQYPTDNANPENQNKLLDIPHSYRENNNLYRAKFHPDHNNSVHSIANDIDSSKRLSVVSDISAEGLTKRKIKQEKKKKGCKIQ